jgi:putative tricarboxylic transport membrane protein
MWRGVTAPPDIPRPAVEFWDRTLTAATRTNAWTAVLAEKLWADTYLPADAVQAFLSEEHELMAGMLRELGLLPGAA